MDYLLPTETPEIKLGYDNRLRVNHNEVTKPNGFVMKADFTHGNDSRVTAKNDLLDDKWDRTMKYDFAGRLTHNQFGMGQSNNNGSVRVYEQALEYDGFSNLSGRSGVNWGAAISFSESYSNGRIQSSLVGYDAAGNVVSQPIDSMPEGTGTSTNDSAGRRVRYFDQRFGRFNGYLNMVQENVTEYVFDGDGRPVVAKHNQRTYQRSAPPSGGLTAMPKTHQVWSTVLGTNLRTIGEIGEGTKILAGGAVIGYVSTATGSRWTTADPVTGTTLRWAGSNGTWSAAAEETEPLGQVVANADPDTENSPGYETAARNSGFPEWQCSIPDSFWAEKPEDRFQSMPFECQQRVLQDLSAGLDEIYGFSNPNNEPDPGNIEHEHSHASSSGPSLTSTLAASALQSSWKPKKKPKKKKFVWTVDISYVPGYVDADEPSVDDLEKALRALVGPGSGPDGGAAFVDDLLSPFLESWNKQAECDSRLSGIFGNGVSVAATVLNPSQLGPTGFLRDPTWRVRDESPSNGTIHLYASSNGIGINETNVFAPPGYTVEKARSGIGGSQNEFQNELAITYAPGSLARYGFRGALRINFTHIGPTNANGDPLIPRPGASNRMGSVPIGIAGGYGGRVDVGGGFEGFGTHTHMIFSSNGKRIDPRSVFCGDISTTWWYANNNRSGRLELNLR
ncbi:MAG: hypothetical protein IPN69_15185 [Acidobacteria bacterium]|nr:hypothetical protein [Acidobacteriota bacterium]